MNRKEKWSFLNIDLPVLHTGVFLLGVGHFEQLRKEKSSLYFFFYLHIDIHIRFEAKHNNFQLYGII